MNSEPTTFQLVAMERARSALKLIALEINPTNPEYLTTSPPVAIITQLYCAELQALAFYSTSKQLIDIAGQLATISKRLQNRD